jgi:hypothetical protein
VRDLAGYMHGPRGFADCAPVGMSLRPIRRAYRVNDDPSGYPHTESRDHGRSDGRFGLAIIAMKSFPWAATGKWTSAVIIGLLVGLLIGSSVGVSPVAKQPEPPSMSQCVADILNLSSQKNTPTAEALRDAREHCYSLIQAQGLLSDFSIRKLNFFQQYRANGVLMWMVVAVTFSGVLLAGLQLWASYQLAMVHKTSLDTNDGHLVLKRDQLILKSSITGLFILLVSFCFFLVYVSYVYRFDVLQDNAKAPPAAVPGAPMGGLGPPTTKP